MEWRGLMLNLSQTQNLHQPCLQPRPSPAAVWLWPYQYPNQPQTSQQQVPSLHHWELFRHLPSCPAPSSPDQCHPVDVHWECSSTHTIVPIAHCTIAQQSIKGEMETHCTPCNGLISWNHTCVRIDKHGKKSRHCFTAIGCSMCTYRQVCMHTHLHICIHTHTCTYAPTHTPAHMQNFRLINGNINKASMDCMNRIWAFLWTPKSFQHNELYWQLLVDKGGGM